MLSSVVHASMIHFFPTESQSKVWLHINTWCSAQIIIPTWGFVPCQLQSFRCARRPKSFSFVFQVTSLYSGPYYTRCLRGSKIPCWALTVNALNLINFTCATSAKKSTYVKMILRNRNFAQKFHNWYFVKDKTFFTDYAENQALQVFLIIWTKWMYNIYNEV